MRSRHGVAAPLSFSKSCLILFLVVLAGCSASAYEQGSSALRDENYEDAVQNFDHSLSLGEEVFFSTRDRGATRLAQGNLEAAAADLEHARSLEPDDARLQWLLGQTYALQKRSAEAADAFRNYKALSSNRSIREQASLKVAQLELQSSTEEAAMIQQARATGTRPAPNTVAVYAFEPQAGEQASLEDQKLCRALAIWVSADLAKVSSLRTIAADQIDLLYQEQGYTYANRQYFEPSSLVVAGNLQAAHYMVRGLYGAQPSEQVVLGASCFDSESASVDQCSLQNGDSAELFELETQLVLDVLENMGITPTRQELEDIGAKPTRNWDAFEAFAEGVYLREIGDFQGAEKAFQQAASIDPGFSMAADAQAQAQVMASPDMVIQVPPPPVVNLAAERANASTIQLGLGLIPEGEDGDATNPRTTGATAARGVASIRVRVDVDGR